MRPVIAGLPVWTDSVGVTHVELDCPDQAPGDMFDTDDGWLCTSCVLVEVAFKSYVYRERIEKVIYGDWRDGRSRAAVRRRRTLARLVARPPEDF